MVEILFYFDEKANHHVAKQTRTHSNGNIDLEYLDKKGKKITVKNVVPKSRAKVVPTITDPITKRERPWNFAINFYKIVQRPDNG